MTWQRIVRAFSARAAGIAAVAAIVSVGSYSVAIAQAAIDGLKPYVPQPGAAVTQPGLAVTYYDVKVRWIEELESFAKIRPGRPGTPLPMLNYNTGAGKVLTTDRHQFVGALIDGFIKLDVPGQYELAAVSNDGIKHFVDGKLIIDAPGVRPTEFTDTVPISIEQPGWYKLHIKYFQRTGTAALEFYWKRPDQAGDLVIVPADAYAHIPE